MAKTGFDFVAIGHDIAYLTRGAEAEYDAYNAALR